jgi:hypothetical protein
MRTPKHRNGKATLTTAPPSHPVRDITHTRPLRPNYCSSRRPGNEDTPRATDRIPSSPRTTQKSAAAGRLDRRLGSEPDLLRSGQRPEHHDDPGRN